MVKLSFKIDRGEIPMFSEYLKEKGVRKYEISEYDDAEEENETQILKEFLSIPQEYRVNPYDYSPSGDLFFADKRNIDKLNASMNREEEKSTIVNPNDIWESIK